jgi:cardiolipin synthase
MPPMPLTILSLIFTLYLVSVAFFIILENRRPQSTYAWLLAFVTLPIVSVILYFTTGRGWKAFSQERNLLRDALGEEFIQAARSRVLSPDAVMQQAEKEKPESANLNLMRLIAHNSPSGLSAYNEVEILQNVDEFYPRLLEDLRNAQHHIHLQYYIWSNDSFTQEVKEVLIEQAKAGVQVRALYDASSPPGEEYVKELQDAGVRILPYLAYNSLRTLHLANYRCHRKITARSGRPGAIPRYVSMAAGPMRCRPRS